MHLIRHCVGLGHYSHHHLLIVLVVVLVVVVLMSLRALAEAFRERLSRGCAGWQPARGTPPGLARWWRRPSRTRISPARGANSAKSVNVHVNARPEQGCSATQSYWGRCGACRASSLFARARRRSWPMLLGVPSAASAAQRNGCLRSNLLARVCVGDRCGRCPRWILARHIWHICRFVLLLPALALTRRTYPFGSI